MSCLLLFAVDDPYPKRLLFYAKACFFKDFYYCGKILFLVLASFRNGYFPAQCSPYQRVDDLRKPQFF